MRYLLLPLTALLSSALCAQSLPPLDSMIRKNEVSLDVTGFIRQFVPNGQDPLFQSYYAPTYLIAYKRAWGKGALRAGLGAGYALDSDTGGYNSHTNFTDYDWTVDLRLGREWRCAVGKRWTGYAGMDLLGGMGRSVSHNMGTQFGTPNVIMKRFAVGAGPLLGIQYHLGPRLSLYTEASLYWFYQEMGTTYDYRDSDENDRKGLRIDASFAIRYPIAVWFAVTL